MSTGKVKFTRVEISDLLNRRSVYYGNGNPVGLPIKGYEGLYWGEITVGAMISTIMELMDIARQLMPHDDQLASQNKEYQDALVKIREYQRRSLFMHADNTVKFYNQIQDIAQAALDGGNPPKFKKPSQESEPFSFVRMALNYGAHRNKCIVMIEMRGPTPITSQCDCGWKEFADKMNRSLKDG